MEKKKKANTRKPSIKKDTVAFYVVDNIKAFNDNKQHPEYLIRWKGYPESQCTWEPLDHLLYLIEDIKEFNTENAIDLDVDQYISFEKKPFIYRNKVFADNIMPPKKKKKISKENDNSSSSNVQSEMSPVVSELPEDNNFLKDAKENSVPESNEVLQGKECQEEESLVSNVSQSSNSKSGQKESQAILLHSKDSGKAKTLGKKPWTKEKKKSKLTIMGIR